MTRWKPIATAPKEGTLVDLWHTGLRERVPNCQNIEGRWIDALGQEWHQPNFTHWYDFGDGKPMPDAPEGT